MTTVLTNWTLGDLGQQGDAHCACQKLLDTLTAAGFDTTAATEIQQMFQASARRLLSNSATATETTDARAFWVPGRIEVLGKHTDYAGGKSLLGAVNKGFAVVSTSRDGQNDVRIFTQFSDGRELNETLRITGTPEDLERLRTCTTDEGGWAAYPAAAVQRLTSNFGITVGADIAIECSLPEASGMSSSSAVICYMWMVLDSYNNISSGINGKATNAAAFQRSIGRVDVPGEGQANLYTFLGNIENGKDFRPGQGDLTLNGMGGVGTFGGSEDHTVSNGGGWLHTRSYLLTRSFSCTLFLVCILLRTYPLSLAHFLFLLPFLCVQAIMSCTKNELKMWEYCPTKHLRTVAVDPDVQFVIAVSGAKAEKTGAAMK